MTTNYHRGRQFEYRVRDLYKKHGWYVLRSAGSKTVTDLVAISKGARQIHFIQCKADGRVSIHEIENLIYTAITYNAVPVLATKKNRKVNLILPDPDNPLLLSPALSSYHELQQLLEMSARALDRVRLLKGSGRKTLRF